MAAKWCTNIEVAWERCPIVFLFVFRGVSSVKLQGFTQATKPTVLSQLRFLDYNSSFDSQMACKWYTKVEMAWEMYLFLFQGYPLHFKVARDKISPILTPIEYFRTATPRFTYAYEIWHEAWRGMGGVSPYFSMSPVKFQFKLSPAEKWTILTRTPVSINRWLQSDAHRSKGHISGALLFLRSSLKFQWHMGQKFTILPRIESFGTAWGECACFNCLVAVSRITGQAAVLHALVKIQVQTPLKFSF